MGKGWGDEFVGTTRCEERPSGQSANPRRVHGTSQRTVGRKTGRCESALGRQHTATLLCPHRQQQARRAAPRLRHRQCCCQRGHAGAPSGPDRSPKVPGARRSPLPGRELGREPLPVAELRHFLSRSAFGWRVPTRVQHAYRKVLLLFRAHLPGPRHDVRPQRLQGEVAGPPLSPGREGLGVSSGLDLPRLGPSALRASGTALVPGPPGRGGLLRGSGGAGRSPGQ